MIFKKMKERILVIILSLAFLLTGVIGVVGTSNAESNEKTITFSVFADFHYDEGKYMTSIADLNAILQRASSAGASFVMSAGDFSTDLPGSPELTKAFHNNQYNLPTYNIYGNHETEYASQTQVTETLTTSNVNWGDGTTNAVLPSDEVCGYYYFDKDGFRIICTDTNYYCTDKTNGADETYWKHYQKGEYGASYSDGYNNGINPVQLTWLNNVLTEAGEDGIPCIIVSHHNLSQKYGTGNASQVREVFTSINAEYPGTIMMAISGHRHTNNMDVKDGILYFSVNSSKLGYYNELGTTEEYTHYTNDHTFEMVQYNDDGSVKNTVTKAIKDLSMGNRNWYREDPLSAIVTVSSSGVITIEGQESDWIYGIAPAPELYENNPGVGTEISSGVFSVSDEDRIISSYHTDISPYRDADNFTAPELKGYTFAGWYKDKAFNTALTADDKTGAAYAKFVPNYVLSVKAQVNQTALEDKITDQDRATIRLVTSVDSLDYGKLGFVITRADASNYLKDTGTNQVLASLSYVDKVGGTSKQVTATQMFGTYSKYFGAYTYKNMPESSVNTEITATPYWITLDGTRVEGTQSVKTINKGRSWIYVNETANEDGLQYGTYEHPYTSIKTALNDVLLKEGGKVWLQSDMEITGQITLENVNATVQSCDAANPATLYNNTNKTSAYVFLVQETGTLGLTDVVLDGRTKENVESGEASTHTLSMVRNLGTLKADNATFQYSHSNWRGGAIYSIGNLTAINCKFDGNIAGQNSGALCIEKGTANISGTEFTNNSVEYETKSTRTDLASGGAMWIGSSATVVINDTLFEDNTVNNTFDADAEDTYAYGGAIYSEGNLTATDCQFKNNSLASETLEDGHGGAVYIKGATAKAIFTKDDGEAIFSGNTATNKGGAILIDSTALENVSVNGYTFNGNSAKYGGAIRLDNFASAKIENATFIQNTVTSEGGAIDVNYDDSSKTAQLQIKNSTFEQNTGANGGALYLNNIKVEVTDSTNFIRNEAIAETGHARGGAVYIDANVTAEFEDVAFEQNVVSTKEDEKYAYGGAVFSKGDLTATDCQFENNVARRESTNTSGGSHGGAVYIEGAASKATFTRNDGTAIFSGNTATNWGGAMVLVNTSLDNTTIDGYTFDQNEANHGGAIHLEGTASGKIENAEFTSNTVTGRGGAIDVNYGSSTTAQLQIKNSTFEQNTGANGGALHLKNIAVAISDNTKFVKNASTAYGGALYLKDVDADVTNGVAFNENTATRGGAIYVIKEGETNTSRLDVEDAEFKSNTVETSSAYGGAISAEANTIVTAKNTLFEGNKVTTTDSKSAFGGAIYTLGSLTATDCQFKSNITNNHGGAICVNGVDAILTLSKTANGTALFNGNTATSWGGALYLINTTLDNTSISGYTFESNSANHGGAIHLEGNANANISDATFEQNQATYRGGAIDVNYSSATENQLIIKNTTFNENVGDRGGALHVKNIDTQLNSGTKFSENVASSSVTGQDSTIRGCGGAIYTEGGELVVESGATFSKNSATSTINGSSDYYKGNGGAIYALGGKLVIKEGATFSMNSASNTKSWRGNGGAIYSSQTTEFEMTGGTFEGNTAKCRGGAICFEAGANKSFTISGGTFQYNSATQGGVIFTARTAEATMIENATMKYNSVEEKWGGSGNAYGGAIYLQGASAKLVLQNVDITDNTHKGGQLTAETVNSRNTNGVDFVFGNTGNSVLYLKDDSFKGVVTWKAASGNAAKINYNDVALDIPTTPTGQYVMDYTNSELVTYTPGN